MKTIFLHIDGSQFHILIYDIREEKELFRMVSDAEGLFTRLFKELKDNNVSLCQKKDFFITSHVDDHRSRLWEAASLSAFNRGHMRMLPHHFLDLVSMFYAKRGYIEDIENILSQTHREGIDALVHAYEMICHDFG